MKRLRLATGVFILAFLALLALYALSPLNSVTGMVGFSLLMASSLAASAFGFYACKIHSLRSVQGRALLLFATAILLSAVGNMVWGVHSILLGKEMLSLSLADVFWFSAYPVSLSGLYYIWKLTAVHPSRKMLAAMAAIVIVVCSSILYLASPTILSIQITFAEKMATAGYAICGMFLISSVIMVVFYLFSGKFARPWGIMLMAILALNAANVYCMLSPETCSAGGFMDILWILFYMLLSFGFFYHRETVREIIETARG